LDDYLSAEFAESELFHIICFWKCIAQGFPTISCLAIEVLCISASNTVIERPFSYSGNTITFKRTRLGLHKLSKLIFLKRNMMVIEKLGQGSISNNLGESTEKRPREGSSLDEGQKRKRYRRDGSDEDEENEAATD
jgi:hAT family C-terminal dimerisation region